VISAQGGAPRRLTPPSIWGLVPSWSRDGKWIYFCKELGGIWKMPSQGGEAVELTKNGLETRESEDGKWLYFSRPLGTPDNKTAILRMPVGGGPETLVFKGVTNRYWALAGQYLYFMDLDAKLHATIKRFNLKTREITRIADVEREPYLIIGWTGFSVSPGGTEILYPQIDEDIRASCWWRISAGKPANGVGMRNDFVAGCHFRQGRAFLLAWTPICRGLLPRLTS
jgi:hypothetical protein